MGYMGFGMRKEVYTRKAKRPAKGLQEVYKQDTRTLGETLKNKANNLANQEMDALKNRIKADAKRRRIKTILFMLLTIVVSYFLFWYFIE